MNVRQCIFRKQIFVVFLIPFAMWKLCTKKLFSAIFCKIKWTKKIYLHNNETKITKRFINIYFSFSCAHIRIHNLAQQIQLFSLKIKLNERKMWCLLVEFPLKLLWIISPWKCIEKKLKNNVLKYAFELDVFLFISMAKKSTKAKWKMSHNGKEKWKRRFSNICMRCTFFFAEKILSFKD